MTIRFRVRDDGDLGLHSFDAPDSDQPADEAIGADASAESAVGAEFLVTLAQELRTPISSLKASFELLRDPTALENRPDELRRLMDNIDRGIGGLEQQATDLLEFVYLRAGNIALRRESTNPHLVIAEALDHVATLADRRRVTVDVKVEEELPELFADQSRTVQVLSNLLSNAIKFTPVEGTVSVDATLTQGSGYESDQSSRQRDGPAKTYGVPDVAHPEGQVTVEVHGPEVEFAVSDGGPGIASEHQAKIFRPFYRIADGSTEGGAGAGLGLALASGLVSLLGGRIWVESEQGKGARFGFTIPVMQDDESSRS